MEQKQTSQMVSWLDEERRKDKALIMKLEERTASQAALLEDQARRTQSLENELAAMRTASLSINLFDESITRLRAEVSATLEKAERSVTAEGSKRIRDAVREVIGKSLEDQKAEILNRVDRELQSRRIEEERLARVAVELQAYSDNMSKGFEEFQRSLAFLEEQRRQDSRRMAEIGSELSEIVKRNESLQAKSGLLEELTRRNERALTELSNSLIEGQSARDKDLLAAQQREKLVTEAVRRVDETLETFNKHVETWSTTYRTMKKHIDEFERTANRTDSKLNEIAEIQRLSEDRFRHEWEEFQKDDQKRFRQFTLTTEESWRENDKFSKSVTVQLGQLGERVEGLMEYVRHLSSLQQTTLDALISYAQTLKDSASTHLKPIP